MSQGAMEGWAREQEGASRDAALRRWLGYPPEYEPAESVRAAWRRAEERVAAWARPWWLEQRFGIAARRQDGLELDGGIVVASRRISERCRRDGACQVAFLLVSLGDGIDRAIDQLWAEDRPDAAYFFDRVAVATLDEWRRDRLLNLQRRCRDAGLRLLQGMGPGHGDWPLADLPALFEAIASPRGGLDRVRVLESGMMHPRMTQLLAYPLTREEGSGMDVTEPCSVCKYVNCAYRVRVGQRSERRMTSCGSETP